MIPKIRVYRWARFIWIADLSRNDQEIRRVGFPSWRDAFDFAHKVAVERAHEAPMGRPWV